MLARIVLVRMSFDIEKDEPAFAIAHHQFIGFARLLFFEDELLDRGV